jgi:hypothetical protein
MRNPKLPLPDRKCSFLRPMSLGTAKAPQVARFSAEASREKPRPGYPQPLLVFLLDFARGAVTVAALATTTILATVALLVLAALAAFAAFAREGRGAKAEGKKGGHENLTKRHRENSLLKNFIGNVCREETQDATDFGGSKGAKGGALSGRPLKLCSWKETRSAGREEATGEGSTSRQQAATPAQGDLS